MDDVNLATTGIPDFNVFGWPYTGLVTVIALAIYVGFSIQVARLRGRYNIHPPDTSGPTEFTCAFRIHMNTLEQLIVFIPLLWIAALSLKDEIAAAIGAVWVVGRILYAMNYPDMRLRGFIPGQLAILALLVIDAVQMVRSAIAWQ